MAERRSNKERVLAKWPDAVCQKATDLWGVYRTARFKNGPRKGQHYRCGWVAYGLTPSQAWKSAASRLSTKGK